MAKIIINKKDGTKETWENIDDIDRYKDHVDIYFMPKPTETINKNEVKSVYVEYELLGIKQVERIL